MNYKWFDNDKNGLGKWLLMLLLVAICLLLLHGCKM